MQLQPRPVLRIVSMGDNAALHRVLVCYVALRHHHPQLFAEIELRIYIVPLGKSNDLCRFVAAHDDWYRREIFAPFSADSALMPRLQPGTEATAAIGAKQAAATAGISSKMGGGTKKTNTSFASNAGGVRAPSLPVQWNPATIQPQLLQSYVRGAQEKLMVNVYQCECWRPDNRGDEADCVVPFVSRLEVGLETNIRQFQEEHPDTAANGWEDVVKDKAFMKKINAGMSPQIEMSVVPVSICGKPKISTRSEACQYAAVAFVNITNDGSDGNDGGGVGEEDESAPIRPHIVSSPVEPWLHCAVIRSKPALMDVMRKAAKKKKDLGQISDYLTSAEDLELQRIQSATLATTEAARSFHVMIDGQIFGPFNRIRVSQAPVPGNESLHLKFPIQTFFPIALADPVNQGTSHT